MVQTVLILHPTKIVDTRKKIFSSLGYSFRGEKIYHRYSPSRRSGWQGCTSPNNSKGLFQGKCFLLTQFRRCYDARLFQHKGYTT